MSKVASVLLKIIIFVSLMGILIFIGIAIFNNINVEFQAYNYIVSTRNNTNFSKLQTEINNNVKWNYGGAQDMYAKYINDAVIELNRGIDYHLDYLALEESLSRGEQDKLSNLYSDYVSKFNSCKKDYQEYISVYHEVPNIEDKNFAENILRNKAVYLIKNYSKCYESGSEFFKYLVEVYRRHSLNDKNYQSFTGISYMIECELVLKSLPAIDADMDLRNASVSFTKNVRVHDKVDSFYDFVTNKTSVGDHSTLNNSPFRNFLNALRLLDVYEWTGNFDAYYETLSDDYKYFASYSLEFYNNNFRGI